MHGILAYEDYGGLLLFLGGEILILFLAFFAVIYAIEEERGKAYTFIAPAVIWIVFWALFTGYTLVRDLFRGNSAIEGHGVLSYITGVVISAAIFAELLPSIAILIVFLILWYKTRE